MRNVFRFFVVYMDLLHEQEDADKQEDLREKPIGLKLFSFLSKIRHWRNRYESILFSAES